MTIKEAEKELLSHKHLDREAILIREQRQKCYEIKQGYIQGDKKEKALEFEVLENQFREKEDDAVRCGKHILEKILMLRFPEREVLFRYFIKKQTIRQIAREMNYSERSIDYYKEKGIKKYSLKF
ncbi:MAG: hypothetical protein R3Y18_00120 [Bacillota bacterium]